MRKFFIFLVGTIIGIFIHAIFIYKSTGFRSPVLKLEKFAGIPTPTESVGNISSITRVGFDGSKFIPSKVYIHIGNYLYVSNNNETELMWLESELPEINTIRGYGQSEQVRAIIGTEGVFVVREKNSGAELEVTVGTK